MKGSIFWDITPCSPWKSTDVSEEHIVSIFKIKNPAACHLLSYWFIAKFILRPWRWRRYIPLKTWLTFNGLHGVISQKTALFIDAVCYNSSPSTPILGKLVLIIRDQLQFKCDSEQNTVWNLTPVEMSGDNAENHKRELHHFQPNVRRNSLRIMLGTVHYVRQS
jgi:hypothetical protein